MFWMTYVLMLFLTTSILEFIVVLRCPVNLYSTCAVIHKYGKETTAGWIVINIDIDLHQ